MIPKVKSELWKTIKLDAQNISRRKYAVSSLGRAASYRTNLYEDGKILNGSITSGYRTLNLHFEEGNGTIYLHREIARLFCKKGSSKAKYVIHLNHKKQDNHVDNLKWAILKEMSDHQQNSPLKIAYKLVQGNRKTGLKLDEAKVKSIKKILRLKNSHLTYIVLLS